MLKRTLFFVVIIAITASSVYAVDFDPDIRRGLEFPVTRVGEVSEIVVTVRHNDDRWAARVNFDAPGNQAFRIDPMQNNLEPGQQTQVTFTFEPEEAGVVRVNTSVMVAIDFGIERIQYAISGEGFAGFPEMRVDPLDIELALGAPGERAEELMSISNGGLADLEFQIELDEDAGWLSVEPMQDVVEPDGRMELTVSSTDFVPIQGEYLTSILIHSNDPEQELLEIAVQFSVGFDPALTVDPVDIDEHMGMDSNADVIVEVTNTGDEGLAFNIARKLVGDQNAVPWDERYNVNYEEQLEDNGLQSVAFAEGFFFVASSNGNGERGKIYQLTPEGEIVNEFDQFVNSRYGMRDLEYDGNLIWGLDAGVLYGFTTAGELETTIDIPDNLSVRCLAYDPDNSIFWLGNITNDFFAVDLEGNLIRTVERHRDLRAYGLAFWGDDPDGYCLYAFTPGIEQDITVRKINTENGDFEIVTELSCGSTRASGIAITNRFDALSWVLVALIQTPDRVAVWQLDSNLDWFTIEPDNAALDAGDSQDLTVTLNTEGLPEGVFEAQFVVTLDNAGGQVILPVMLSVEAGGVQERVIDLEEGWNLVSTNVVPEDNDIIGIMSNLVDADLLLLMKDGAGRFYSPAFGFNNIPGWDVSAGYQMKMDDAGALGMIGMPVMADEPIVLAENWNMIAYYPRRPVDAVAALSGIVDQLTIAKDGDGRFYNPQFNFSNMGDMLEGFGYQIKVREAIELVYQLQLNDELIMESTGRHFRPTDSNMSVLVFCDESNSGSMSAYNGELLVGKGDVVNGIGGLAIWGDDSTTPKKDGLLNGESFEIRFENQADIHSSEILSGNGLVYETDAFTALQIAYVSSVPQNYYLSESFPNPFNNSSKISYGLPETSEISISVFDLNGRLVSTILNQTIQAGHHSISWNAEGMGSGTYLIQMHTGNFSGIRKVVLVK
ncbi:MAG: T9SS type A sorting domain-containing protein [Calditrichaeota bacterium]|jgi:hypothetical protein|nr:T9SS type A sorting domain-containing protein [Calditrichota bacterium]